MNTGSGSRTVLHEADTDHGHYQIVDMTYNSRPSRLLLSGPGHSAQSGIALDDSPRLLFDYNQFFFDLISKLFPSTILLIGGGVYTLPMAVLRAFPQMTMTIVEPDIALDDIATEYFNFHQSPRLEVIHTDGLGFIESSAGEFDLAILDAFQGDRVPDSLASETALRGLRRIINPGGHIAQNIIASYSGPTSGPLKRRIKLYEQFFHDVYVTQVDSKVPRWASQNLIIEGVRTVAR